MTNEELIQEVRRLIEKHNISILPVDFSKVPRSVLLTALADLQMKDQLTQ